MYWQLALYLHMTWLTFTYRRRTLCPFALLQLILLRSGHPVYSVIPIWLCTSIDSWLALMLALFRCQVTWVYEVSDTPSPMLLLNYSPWGEKNTSKWDSLNMFLTYKVMYQLISISIMFSFSTHSFRASKTCSVASHNSRHLLANLPAILATRIQPAFRAC